MKKVMVFGTFDLFHKGHRNFLKQTRDFGDYLIVVVARDRTVLEIKKRAPLNRETERAQVVNESGLAEEVVLGNLENKYEIINNFKPDVICLGYDQKFFIADLSQKLKEFGLEKTEVIRLESFMPQTYKSSILRKFE